MKVKIDKNVDKLNVIKEDVYLFIFMNFFKREMENFKSNLL